VVNKTGGWRHTEEAKAKMRAARLGKKLAPETCAKIQKKSLAMWKAFRELKEKADRVNETAA
jgi:hypothetical protein